MDTIRVAIIEDDEDVRMALQVLISGSAGFQCEHAFGAVESALAQLPLDEIDVLLMDIHLPGMNGIEGVQAFKAKREDLQMMMVTVYDDDEHVFNALKAGAGGYLLKRTPPVKMLESIRELHNGGAPMSAEIARRVVVSFQQASPAKAKPAVELQQLTPREREVLDLLAIGHYYKEIAGQLHISLDTVKRHISHIYGKLHVQNRTEAINKAFPRQ